MEKRDKMLERIQLLLAKAESTTHEEERKTFSGAAEKMMLRWGIERAELEAAGGIAPDDIVCETYEFTGQYAMSAVYGCSWTCDALRTGVYVLYGPGRNQEAKRAHFIGPKDAVAAAVTLCRSLERQARASLKLHQKLNAEARWWMDRNQKWHSDRAYFESFWRGVRSRLLEEHEQVSTGAALVLANATKRTEEWLAKNIPDLRPGKDLPERRGDHASRQAGFNNGRMALIRERLES